jgi:hypothetical protein
LSIEQYRIAVTQMPLHNITIRQSRRNLLTPICTQWQQGEFISRLCTVNAHWLCANAHLQFNKVGARMYVAAMCDQLSHQCNISGVHRFRESEDFRDENRHTDLCRMSSLLP